MVKKRKGDPEKIEKEAMARIESSPFTLAVPGPSLRAFVSILI